MPPVAEAIVQANLKGRRMVSSPYGKETPHSYPPSGYTGEGKRHYSTLLEVLRSTPVVSLLVH